jgi:mannosyltransferase OCH1-like enzyme
MTIPKLLVQTGFATNHSPSGLSERNPEYTYLYFNNKNCVAFLTEHFDAQTVAAFHSLRPGAFKADLFRYCFLYIKGGVYLDLDMKPEVELDVLVKPGYDFISCLERRNIPGVYQGFMAARPGLPFLAKAIHQIVLHTQTRYYPPLDRRDKWISVLSITGPCLLYQAMEFAQRPCLGLTQTPWGRLYLYRFREDVFDGETLLVKNKIPYRRAPNDNYYRLFMNKKVYCSIPI